MSRALALALCVVTPVVVAVPSPVKSAPRLVDDGQFVFAASGEYRPFSFVDDQQQLVGFDIDVGLAIAKDLGLRGRAKKYKFAAIVEGVKAGRFDAAVASHTVTEERRQHVSFSTPYYYSGPQVFTRPGSSLRTIEDLRDAEVAVSKGSSYAKMMEGVTERVRLYDSDVTALSALNEGRHDAVVTDFITGRLAIEEGMRLEGRQRLERSEQAVAVAKDNPELLAAVNGALERLRKSGTLAELSRKYFGEDISAQPPSSADASVLAAKDKAQGQPEASQLSAADSEGAVGHFFEVLWSSKVLFLEAAYVTFRLTLVAILLGCVIGLGFAFLKVSGVPVLGWVSDAYVYLVRGTPLIVQIFVLYFGLTSVMKIPGFWAASLALAFHNGAYIAEIFRGAIQSIDPGQMEASRSLGMGTALAFRRVILPQAVLRALPALGNQGIIALKDSSLAAFISMNELFNVATTQGANNFDQMTYLLVVAVYYLALVLALTGLVGWMERELGKGLYA